MATSSNNQIILDAVQTALADVISQGRFVCVAFSGGVDSMVLLHALKTLNIDCKAIHINHGLQQESEHWVKSCSAFCRNESIEFECIQLTLELTRNIESQARDARYKALFNAMPKDSVLVTAHHADDQLETLLLRLVRGSGLRGLAGIRSISTRSTQEVCRPLLSTTRMQIESYAREYHLHWVEDPSNQTEQFDRNFIRHQVVPQLKARWSNVLDRVQTSAQHLQEEAFAFDYLLNQQLNERQEGEKLKISDTPIEVESRILQVWLNQWGIEAPKTRILTLIAQMKEAGADSLPSLSFKQGTVYVYNEYYWFEASKSYPKWSRVRIKRNLNTLRPTRIQCLPAETVKSVKIHGDNHHRKLRQLMKIYQVPPWRRAQIPVVLINDELCSIGGIINFETGHKGVVVAPN